jgi:hypothetical protein
VHWSTFKFFFAIVLMDRVKEWRLKGRKWGWGGALGCQEIKEGPVTTIKF